MERPEQDVIETFMSITGASAAVALGKLQEHGGDLNRAVNDYFNEGEINVAQPAIPAPDDGFMDMDNTEMEPRQPLRSSLFSDSSLNPFSLLDPAFISNIFNGGAPHVGSSIPLVSHPREVREIPIEFRDGNSQPAPSGSKPTIEEVSNNAELYAPETHETVTVDDDDDDEVKASVVQGRDRNKNTMLHDTFDRFPEPSAPDLIDDQNEIEEEMLRSAIEASKQYPERVSLSGVDDTYEPLHRQNPPVAEDPDLARAVSLSLKTAEQEKAIRELRAINGDHESEVQYVPGGAGPSTVNGSSSKGGPGQIDLEAGNSSIPGETDDAEDEPFVRRRSRRLPSRYVDTSSESDQQMEPEAPSSTAEPNPIASQGNGNYFHSDEWGGISSEEHDEAVMLEAAMFGGIPEEGPYRFAYPSHQGAQISSSGHVRSYSRPLPRPPSPTLTAQRLLREQQDDEYLASLLADQEKEQKAMQEAEVRRLEEAAAREAAIQKEKQQEEAARQLLLEQQQLERDLADKKASLPQEPAPDNESAVTLLIRMPDGSRRGRRFLKSDKLHSLFDFIDVGGVVKPGTYRLVMPYPRRAFSDAEKDISLNELGLTSKQEALFLEFL